MSHESASGRGITVPDLQRMRAEGRPIVMTTAYDAPTAVIADAAGIDAVLVGDSVGNVCLGFGNTLPVTMAMMEHHLGAVSRARIRALLVVDMPYLSYHLGAEEAVRNAGSFMRIGAQAVKLEGGSRRIPAVRALVEAEIPVMGHLGLTPQSLNAMGGYRVQGREAGAAVALLEDALRLQDAGCFSLVLEGVPAELAERVTQELSIPTIGIGAGAGCSGQVLVFHDVLGLIPVTPPKFVRSYMNGFEMLREGLARYAEDVRGGRFPGPQESYMLPEPAREELRAWKQGRQGE